jgi:membrane protein involved in colicin uptake
VQLRTSELAASEAKAAVERRDAELAREVAARVAAEYTLREKQIAFAALEDKLAGGTLGATGGSLSAASTATDVSSLQDGATGADLQRLNLLETQNAALLAQVCLFALLVVRGLWSLILMIWLVFSGGAAGFC